MKYRIALAVAGVFCMAFSARGMATRILNTTAVAQRGVFEHDVERLAVALFALRHNDALGMREKHILKPLNEWYADLDAAFLREDFIHASNLYALRARAADFWCFEDNPLYHYFLDLRTRCKNNADALANIKDDDDILKLAKQQWLWRDSLRPAVARVYREAKELLRDK